jgi:hypothetical protein
MAGTAMIIEGIETEAGKAAEAAYRAKNRATGCPNCGALGKAFMPCLCGSFLLPAISKPLQITLPTWC